MGLVGLIGAGEKPATIQVSGVTKRYPNGVVAVKDVSLKIDAGECLALVGPRGAGKSTLLSIIAGDEPVSVGKVTVDGKDLLPSKEREGLALVRKELRPDATVYENLSSMLESLGLTKPRIRRVISSTARTLGIEDLLNRYPKSLSPVQQDKALYAKAMIAPAGAYLLDDPKKKPWEIDAGIEGSIAALRELRRATVVCATTEPQEAVSLGGRLAVMNAGTVEQVGEAQAILNDPQTLNVARIVASNDSAFLDGKIVNGKLRLPEGEFTLPPRLQEAVRRYGDGQVVVRVSDERLRTGSTGIRSYAASAQEVSSSAVRALLRSQRAGGSSRRLPFDSNRILAFAADTGDRIAIGEPEAVVARPVGDSPATKRGDAVLWTVPRSRSVNAWLIGTEPPIPVGQEVPVGFRIGPAVRNALASAVFNEPDWGGLEEIDCDVILLSDGCQVTPAGRRLTVPRLGPSAEVEFHIRALTLGSILLRFQIYLATGSLLLQELVTSIEAVRQAAGVGT